MKKRSLTREQFLFHEGRVTARLLAEGNDRDAALARILQDNLFQFPTERSIRNIAQVCLRRIEALGQQELVELLAFAPAEVARQVNLYAVMRDNRLVWEFMTDVIGDKYRQRDEVLTRLDLHRFFQYQRESDPQVAAWSDATCQKCGQVLRQILRACGYLDPADKTGTRLCAVQPAPELKACILQNGDQAALAAFYA